MSKGGLRPRLPDHVPAAVRQLIFDSWQDDPALRPSFAVIVWSLREMIRVGFERSESQPLLIARELKLN